MTDTAIYDTLTTPTTQENRHMGPININAETAIRDLEAAYPTAARPIETAFADLSTAIARLEHQLGDLNGVVMSAGIELAPILTDGTYTDPDEHATLTDAATSPEDRRSTIARRIDDRALEVNRYATAAATIADRLRAILSNVEL